MENDRNTNKIVVSNHANSLLKEVVGSINGYLESNKGNAADFHLLKNIVDRHLDTIDEEVGHMLPVPLYLGLAGTMIGIITGLMCINGDVNSEAFVNSISIVIDHIKWAMLCSLIGLLMTTFLSAWVYRKAKAKMEIQKNDFLDFLQTKLLPHLNEDATATLLNMQANLQKFNTDFQTNLTGFNGIMKEVHEAFDSQVQLVQKLNQMDLVQMGRLNVTTLDKLHQSMGEFEKFTRYLSQMNTFVTQTTRLTNSINDQLDRTNLVREVADGVRENIDRNNTVMEMLNTFLARVNEDAAILEASKNLDSAVSTAMNEMKKHVENEVNSLKAYTEKATTDLEALMTRERGQLDKLKSLEKLDSLSRAVQKMADDSHTVNVNLAKRITELSEAISGGVSGGSKGLPSWVSYIVAIFIIAACCCLVKITFWPTNQEEPQIPTEVIEGGASNFDEAPSGTENNMAPAPGQMQPAPNPNQANPTE